MLFSSTQPEIYLPACRVSVAATGVQVSKREADQEGLEGMATEQYLPHRPFHALKSWANARALPYRLLRCAGVFLHGRTGAYTGARRIHSLFERPGSRLGLFSRRCPFMPTNPLPGSALSSFPGAVGGPFSLATENALFSASRSAR